MVGKPDVDVAVDLGLPGHDREPIQVAWAGGADSKPQRQPLTEPGGMPLGSRSHCTVDLQRLGSDRPARGIYGAPPQREPVPACCSSPLRGCLEGAPLCETAAMALYELSHPGVASGAQRHYAASLAAIRDEPARSTEARRAAAALIRTLEAAVAKGGGTTTRDLEFGIEGLKTLGGTPELALFVNQYQLGLGWDGAEIIAMGTEAADDPTDPEDVAWQSLQGVLILSGSPAELVRPLVTESKYWARCVAAGAPPEPWRPIHVHPNDFEQIQRRAFNHTWCNLARVVAEQASGWRDLLEIGASPGLGDLVYQIERSGRPAKRSRDGSPPSNERTDWLAREVLPELRRTARVLLLHGFGRGRAWERSDIRLVRSFLGLTPTDLPAVGWTAETKIDGRRGNYLWQSRVGDHTVLWTRALGWPWSLAYLEAAREAVRRGLQRG